MDTPYLKEHKEQVTSKYKNPMERSIKSAGNVVGKLTEKYAGREASFFIKFFELILDESLDSLMYWQERSD